MRRRSRAGGETIKKRGQIKRRNATKAVRRRSTTSAAEREARVAQLTKELHEAREHQTATTDVLRIISSSPGELNAVFHAILANATKLCEASYGTLWLSEGDAFRVAAQYGALPTAYMERLRPGTLFRLGPHLPSVQAIKSRRPVQVSDLRLAQAYIDREPLAVAAVELAGIYTMFTVPMFRDSEPLGVIAIYRQEMRPFTDKHIGLVQDFAAQAVIAIENTRLLTELRQLTDDLTDSLEDLRITQDRLVQTEKLASLGQ
jgi:GAF domain-containing protein